MQALIIVYILAILIAFLSSLISFRLDFPVHFKIFSFLLALTFLVEFFVGFVVKVFHFKNNFWVYNAFSLVEFWTFGYFYYQVIRIKLLRRIIFLFLVIFPIFWLITVFFLFGFNIWNSYVIIVGSFFSILFAIMYYCQVVTAREIQSLRNLPEFWIATGMLIFYLGALPYFGTLNFLIGHYLQVAQSLLKVLVVLDTLMYAMFAYGFLCRIINTTKS